MIKLLLFVTLVLLFTIALLFIENAQAACEGSNWDGTKTLDATVEYTLNYKIDGEYLVIRLRAKTLGFLGFGFSESGHMIGSDIVTSAVINGYLRVEDRFAGWTSFPTSLDNIPKPREDKCSHWSAVCGSEDSQYTTVIVSRRLDTNDTEDRPVTRGLMNIIYSWGEDDTINYHGANRGSTTVAFFNDVETTFVAPADANSTTTITLNNYAMTTTVTQYVVQEFDLGTTIKHIVAIEPVIAAADLKYVRKLTGLGFFSKWSKIRG
jgi:hypothetical protein